MASPPWPTSGQGPSPARTAARPYHCSKRAGCVRKTTSALSSLWSRTPTERELSLAYNMTRHRWQREVQHRNVSTISNWLAERCLVLELPVPAVAQYD